MKHLNIHEDIASYISKIDDYSKLKNAVNLIKNEGISFDNNFNESIVIIKTTLENEEVIFQFWDNTETSTINWGDGNEEILRSHAFDAELGHSDDYARHTYALPGEYTVILKGDNVTSHWAFINDEGKWYTELDGINIPTNLHDLELAFPKQTYKAIQLGNHTKSCIELFAHKNNLIEISKDLFKYCPSVENYDWCFSTSNIVTVPSDLFKYSQNVKTMESCFRTCKSLTHISGELFKPLVNVTTFAWCFRFCTALGNIPAKLFETCKNVTNFSYCFRDCTSITSIPSELFKHNVNATNFLGCFWDCTALTSCENIFTNCEQVTDFSNCFRNCTALEQVATGLFDKNKNVSLFSYCFYNCAALNHAYNLTSEGEPKLWERAGMEGYPSTITSTSFATKASTSLRASVPSTWGGTMKL